MQLVYLPWQKESRECLVGALSQQVDSGVLQTLSQTHGYRQHQEQLPGVIKVGE